MEFVDLYSGAGGWTLGLSLAGLRPVYSAEIWKTANAARAWNFGHADPVTDVRALDPASLPRCGFLVGSPPCTQFSYANRGGGGDLEDGLHDVRAFLRAVRAANPRYWVMENVPRLSGILADALQPGGPLEEFRELFDHVDDFDMSEWGVPQRRRRCIAGRYPRDLLMAMRGRRAPTLGEVVAACAAGRDPVWGDSGGAVTDNVPGISLSWEEARTNLEKKRNHPIYNDMAFPDDPGRTARTVTATCTKVSRESIVVPDGHGGHRLLTVRESAAIQSFPLSYQFAAGGRSDRIKMAGNAIPPLFTYMIGLAVQGLRVPDRLPSFAPARGPAASAPAETASTRPPRAGRRFRAAISELRFKSGMSFELGNGSGEWEMSFNAAGHGRPRPVRASAIEAAAALLAPARGVVPPPAAEIQAAWEASDDCPQHPYRVTDSLGAAAAARLPDAPERAEAAVRAAYASVGLDAPAKALRNAAMIASGLAVAAEFNRVVLGALAEAA